MGTVLLTKFFTREEVKILTDAPDITIDRWSKALRETDMVFKRGGRLLYTDLFVTFIRSRITSTGPAGLPSAERIAELLDLHKRGLTSVEMAEYLQDNFVTVEAQLMSLNLAEENKNV